MQAAPGRLLALCYRLSFNGARRRLRALPLRLMSPTLVLSLVAGYFAVLIVIAILTSRGATSESFFVANRNAPWYMVAFAMIGTSLSGVTFISVPGNVYGKSWSYLAVALGFVAGYVVIGTVLMPLYYRLRLVSIYTYLDQRFGYWSYKTGALFFLISRSLGSALRLYLVAGVLQLAVFDAMRAYPQPCSTALESVIPFEPHVQGSPKRRRHYPLLWEPRSEVHRSPITCWILGTQHRPSATAYPTSQYVVKLPEVCPC